MVAQIYDVADKTFDYIIVGGGVRPNDRELLTTTDL